MKQGVLACLLFTSFFCSAQPKAIVNFKLGVESWALKDEMDLTGQSMHPGQFFGFDVYVERNRSLFVPGFHYHRISVENEEEKLSFNLRQPHHLHYFTIPITYGYRVVDRTLFNISAMAGGEVTFFYDLDANDVGLDDDMLYGVSTNLTGIVQVEFISLLTAEIKYHHGLQPIINIRDQSKLRGYTFALGVKF